jgi:hypothetical protein
MKRCSKPGQGMTRIFESNIRNGESTQFPIPHNCGGAVINRFLNVGVTIRIPSAHGNKQIHRLHSAAVNGNAADLDIRNIFEVALKENQRTNLLKACMFVHLRSAWFKTKRALAILPKPFSIHRFRVLLQRWRRPSSLPATEPSSTLSPTLMTRPPRMEGSTLKE